MKRMIMPMLVLFLFSVLLVAEVINNDDVKAFIAEKLLTNGTANFGVRTVTYNGPYGPRNAGVIWVTDSNNQFVKTIKVWASNYRYTLRRWIASSNQNMTGAITSASLNTHQLHNVSWDGNNWQNAAMPDGTYKFNIEFTEHNATTTNLGKYKQLSFVKGPDPVDLVIPNETYFRDMSLTWTPVITNGTLSGRVTNTSNIPLAGAVVSTGTTTATSDLAGEYSLSLAPGIYNVTCTANGHIAQSFEAITIASGQASTLNISLGTVSNNDPTDIGQLVLSPPYPNPARTSCRISFRANPSNPYELSVFNSRGQKVRSMTGLAANSEWIDLVWDGRDSNLQECPSGLYIIRLRSGAQQSFQKVSLSR